MSRGDGFVDAIIRMRGISKSFGSLRANDLIDFELYPGETHALVGENGAGKTTLMRILYGQYKADSGTIEVDGKPVTYNVAGAMKLGIGMVHQNFMQIEKMSILENIIMASAPSRFGFIRYKETRGKVQEMLRRFGLEVSPDVPIGRLCVGERQKVEIIKALYLGARVLILDEPTAVLTPQETMELFRIIEELKGEGKSIIFISHKLREVVQVGDRITVIRAGQVVAQMARGVQENDIARAMIHRQDTELIKNDRTGEIGECVCKAEHLWYFDDLSVPRLKDFSMEVHAGEILGIGGVEGNGQTELINLLVGMYRASHGTITFCGEDITKTDIETRRNKGVSYISEDRMNTGLCLSAKLGENLICGREGTARFSRRGVLQSKSIEQYSEELKENFDIRGVSDDDSIRGMSGGNLQKIVLAREISRGPKLLIAAQPTRGLDIGAINFVRSTLLEEKKKGAAILLVSADLEELMSLSDRMLILCGGKCSGEVTDVAEATEEEIGLLMGGITHSGEGGETA